MKRQIIRPIVGLLVAGLTLGVASRALADGTRIGVVDLQRAFMEVDEGKAALAQLKKDHAEKQKLLDEKQDELKSLSDDLAKRADTMDPAKRKAKQAELQRKYLQLQQTAFNLQQQLLDRQKKLTNRILSKMVPIIAQIAQENDLDVVLKSEGVAWAKDSLDLTNELVRRYNARFGGHHGSTARHHRHHKSAKTAKKK